MATKTNINPEYTLDADEIAAPLLDAAAAVVDALNAAATHKTRAGHTGSAQAITSTVQNFESYTGQMVALIQQARNTAQSERDNSRY